MGDTVRMFVVVQEYVTNEPACMEVFGSIRGERIFRASKDHESGRPRALGFRAEVPVSKVHQTQREAWLAYVQQKDEGCAMLRKDLAKAERQMATAQKRLAELPT